MADIWFRICFGLEAFCFWKMGFERICLSFIDLLGQVPRIGSLFFRISHICKNLSIWHRTFGYVSSRQSYEFLLIFWQHFSKLKKVFCLGTICKFHRFISWVFCSWSYIVSIVLNSRSKLSLAWHMLVCVRYLIS